MQLPETNELTELHSRELSPCLRVCVLDGKVSKLLSKRDADAALCAMSSKYMKVAPGPQYCWVCVNTPKAEEGEA